LGQTVGRGSSRRFQTVCFGPRTSKNVPIRPEEAEIVPKTPPSDEVLDEITSVVTATMTYPDEEVLAIAVTVFVKTPNGRMGRSVVQPPDAAEDVLEIIRRQLAGEDPRTWDGE
jgi:hypothetical protein